ncbi:MAG: epoxyqueuosine reductase QueH [Fusobacteriaceae bacterium]
MKLNYENIMVEMLKKISPEKKSLLLHSCCAPCSSAVIEFLADYFDITILFYNPNITDSEEYTKRKDEHLEYIKKNNLNLKFLEGNYDTKNDFFIPVKGLEESPEGGERCTICYRLRMEKTVQLAKELGFHYFTTVLSISPLKNSEKINNIGVELQEEYGVTYLFGDFKKKGRYLRSIQLSKEHELYRQDFCGCIFSKVERESLKKQ